MRTVGRWRNADYHGCAPLGADARPVDVGEPALPLASEADGHVCGQSEVRCHSEDLDQ